MVTAQPTVLLVDDEKDVVDVYALAFTDGKYTVLKAYSGEEALELVADADVVLLDRRMPGLSGQEVLDEIRSRGLDVRVAMVTAVDPDFDITDMEFDTYLIKPVSDEELRETVDELLMLAEYDERIRERFSVAEKLALLETEKTERELAVSDEYQSLQERASELDAVASETIGDMSPETFERALSGLIDDGDANDDGTP
ncbi:response regulator [Haloplanus aerogenes]|uniref:HalX domain-containing protein n=1 Tax=Haloplanus aerogenes TaxID=660522 RepID=A0A3M0DX64_9EURY|nr:response regulator [Haloplanus aerogenes]AZH25715.1 response regulator [Haloplanus aerogenes]RMB25447.1 HalX domain-containing protein [Haloplanus aerogenes]